MWVQGNTVRKDTSFYNYKISSEHSQIAFSEDYYYSQIDNFGLKNTWLKLIDYLLENGIEKFNSEFVDFYDIGRLYEFGLAHENKFDKKKCGKYYTPKDVSKVMSSMLCENENLDAVADVGCGCGNLIIAVLEELEENAKQRFDEIANNGIYLFDNDEIAMEICFARIKARFNIDEKKIHKMNGDFLAKNIFPENLSVIANPPYVSNSKIVSDAPDVNQVGDLYIAFFSKICDFAQNITIVTPQSFIVGQNFSLFRKKLNDNFYGEIFSFDNVPCPLFNGKKAGIFNTNNANGVRASISNLHRKTENSPTGFLLSHLIRFKSEQRESVINKNFLYSTLGDIRQDLSRPIKSFKSLEQFAFDVLKDCYELGDLISKEKTNYPICVATSARYFISASNLKQKRSGFFELYANSKKSFNLLYALLNSSYCYMWYRFFDGGILLPKSLLEKTPIPRKLNFDENDLETLVSKIIATEDNCKSYKRNGGAIQEVVKFPETTRNELNKFLFGDVDFSPVHRNFEVI